MFLLLFLHTITVQTRKVPPRKTKSSEATTAATILPSSVLEVWCLGDGMGVMTPNESEGDDSTANGDVSTGSVAVQHI